MFRMVIIMRFECKVFKLCVSLGCNIHARNSVFQRVLYNIFKMVIKCFSYDSYTVFACGYISSVNFSA